MPDKTRADTPAPKPPDRRLLPGIILQGRYRILEELASGGMGVVFRAERVDLGRAVAIKFLRAPFAANPDALKRFEREALTMSRLTHPNCVSVIDIGIHESMPYIVMDFVSGRDLRTVLKQEGRLPPGRAIHITRQILSASSHAHSHGLVHRDIKPANIMLSDAAGTADHVLVLDFGLAKFHRETFGDKLTATDIVLGTPAYMSPEQSRTADVGPASDIYSIGVVLFELITGDKPYIAQSPLDVVKQHRKAPVPSARERLGASEPLSADLDEVIRMAMAKDAAQRFSNAAAFAEALAALPEAASYTPRMMTALSQDRLQRLPKEGAEGGGAGAPHVVSERARSHEPEAFAHTQALNTMDLMAASRIVSTPELSANAADVPPDTSSDVPADTSADTPADTPADTSADTAETTTDDLAPSVTGQDVSSPTLDPSVSEPVHDTLDELPAHHSAGNLVIASSVPRRGPHEPTMASPEAQATRVDSRIEPTFLVTRPELAGRSRRRRLAIGLGAALVALAVVMVALLAGRGADDGTGSDRAATTEVDDRDLARRSDAVDGPDVPEVPEAIEVIEVIEVRQVKDVERLIELGQREQAIAGIHKLLGRSTHERNGYLYLLLGHLSFETGAPGQGLDAYDKAIRYKRDYRSRELINVNAIEALAMDQWHKRADDLFLKRIRFDGVSYLKRAARSHDDPVVRERATRLIERIR